MIGISFLGTGKYSETYYHQGKKEVKTRFFPVTLKELFGVTRSIIIMTEEAKNTHGQSLSEEMEYECILIPSGKAEVDYYTIFERMVEAIPAESSVVLDVTHGFRAQPMLALSATIYLKYLKNVSLEAIYYGAFEARDGDRTPIFELTPFLDLIDWSFALRNFRERGDATELSLLMAEYHKQTYLEDAPYKSKLLSKTGKHLEELMNGLAVIRPVEVMSEAGYLPGLLKELQADLGKVYQAKPLSMMMDEIEGTVKVFSLEEGSDLFSREGVGMQMEMIKHSVRVGRYQQALTLITELLFSVACIKKRVDPLNKELRLEMSRRMTSISKGFGVVHAPIEEWEEELADILHEATMYRNDLNHAGMNNEPKSSKSIVKMTARIAGDTGEFLQKYFYSE